jgi:hypothetical protein
VTKNVTKYKIQNPGGIDYDLDQTSDCSSKNDKVLMSTAGPANLFGKIWIAQKQGLPYYYCKLFEL